MDASGESISDTNGVSLWRAGCAERCKSGSEGGLQKPIDRNVDTALQSDPYTYVPTWSGMVYTALVLDVFSRKIVGWRTAKTMSTSLVLDALEMAIWSRDGNVDGVIHHSDAGSQYTSIKYTDRLAEVGAAPSIGSVGDAYDNAMAESLMGTYKNELIKQRGPWRNVDEVELETLSYVDWFNNQRLHGKIGYVPPAEFEESYYRNHAAPEKEAEVVAI